MFERNLPHTVRGHDRPARPGIARHDVIVAILVVGLLIFVLVLLILPSRENARRSACQRRQWAVARAILEYEAAHEEFPGYRNLQATNAAGMARPTGWVFPVLPYLQTPQTQLAPLPPGGDTGDADATKDPAERPAPPYLEIFAEYGPDGPDEKRGQPPTRSLLELICPSGTAADRLEMPNRCYWVANAGMPDARAHDDFPPDWPANGVFLDLFSRGDEADAVSTSVTYIKLHDGLASTLLLSENVDSGEWTDVAEARVGFVWRPDVEGSLPASAEQILRINQRAGEGEGSLRFARPSSFHVGGVNVVFVSGKLQFLNEQINDLVYVRLMMSNSREPMFPATDQRVPPPYRLVEDR